LSEKANLRKDLENWRGKGFTEAELAGFDVESIRGANCLLTITETESGKRKVSGVTALPKGMQPIKPYHTSPTSKFMDWIEKERAKAIVPNTDVSEPPPLDRDSDLPF